MIPNESEKPLSGIPEELLADVLGCREAILSVVESVNETTEREVLALGACLERAGELGRGFIEGTATRLNEVTDPATGLLPSIERQVSALSDWQSELSHLSKTIEALDAETEGVMRRTSKITSASQEMARVATSTKVLSINATIEASRVEHGGAFEVIATEMRTLSVEVEELTQIVQGLAQQIEDGLPKLAEQVRDAKDRSSELEVQLGASVAELTVGGNALSTFVQTTLDEGKSLTTAVMDSMQQGSGHITFQDPARQKLLRVDHLMWKLEHRSRDLLELPDVEQTSRPPLQVEMGETVASSDEEDLGEGEIMLF